MFAVIVVHTSLAIGIYIFEMFKNRKGPISMFVRRFLYADDIDEMYNGER